MTGPMSDEHVYEPSFASLSETRTSDDFVKSKNILEEAYDTVEKNRQKSYGDPIENFNHAAEIANLLINGQNTECKPDNLTGKDIVKVMIAVKLSRETNQHKRDNLVDLCGYTEILNKLEDDKDGRI